MSDRKIVLNLNETTFQYLEVLAFGLNQEAHEGDNDELKAGHNKEKDDFGPLVARMLEGVAGSIASGVDRPGSWERGVIEQLTGWDGTVYPGMFGDKVKGFIKD